MLVKLNVTDNFANKIKLLTGSAVASKAFYSAAENYVDLLTKNKKLEQQLETLKQQSDKQIAKLQQRIALNENVMTQAKAAAKALIAHVEKKKQP